MNGHGSPARPQLRASSHRLLTSGRALEASIGVRHCAVDGCGARLSRYNPDATCSLHSGWNDPPQPARRRGPMPPG